MTWRLLSRSSGQDVEDALPWLSAGLALPPTQRFIRTLDAHACDGLGLEGKPVSQ